jgi:hypothetical protein
MMIRVICVDRACYLPAAGRRSSTKSGTSAFVPVFSPVIYRQAEQNPKMTKRSEPRHAQKVKQANPGAL